MKIIMENWKRFVNETGFDPHTDRGAASTTFGKKLYNDFEGFAQSQGIPGTASPEEEYILANARLNITGEVIPVARRAGAKVDKDFLIAWVTGRLSAFGGPDIEKAQRLYGDHTDAKLFTKFKDFETKHDFTGPQQVSPAPSTTPQVQDHPADGMTPIGPHHADTHEGGVQSSDHPPTQPASDTGTPAMGPLSPSTAPVTADRVLPALKALLTKDFSTPAAQQDLRRVLKTLVNALESQSQV